MGSGRKRTVAAAALAAGRPAVASSFRFHRPRGPVCGRGYCCACEIPAPDGRVLACETGADAAVPRRRDLLRPLGRIAERWPPWFYERRFLRTELVRRASLDVLRRVSAAPRLGDGGGEAAAPRAYVEESVGTVVVGDGVAASADPDAYLVDPAQGDIPLGVYGGRVLGLLRGDRLLEVRFEHLVLATGSYDRLPPVDGNDLPGVVGLPGLERYAPDLPARTRIAVWGPPEALARAERLAAEHRFEVVWASRHAPARIEGRGRVERIATDGGAVSCDLFVTAVEQPAIELALQAGATVALTSGELPILVVVDAPGWLELRGAVARDASGVPDVRAHDDAFACLCEDVRVGDLRACVASGFAHPELVKRRTGAMTGPCQGKLCASAVLSVLREQGVDAVPTTARPLARPVSLRDLAAHV